MDYYIFRLISSRGTDICECWELESGLKKQQVKDIVDDWADGIMNNSPIESATVSWEKVKLPSRKILLEKHSTICKRESNIRKERQKLAAMLNPRNQKIWRLK